MTLTQTVTTFGLISLFSSSVLNMFGNLTEPNFMHVYGVEVSGEKVIADRRVKYDVIADWRVTVVGGDDDAPSCATIPGNKLHEGWSKYTAGPRAQSYMSLDVWVGDAGCYDRLIPGSYFVFETWTPRDGSAPITNSHTFLKK